MNLSRFQDEADDIRHEVGGLYYLDITPTSPRVLQFTLSPFQWHCRLGHPSFSILKCQLVGLNNVSSFQCETCQFSKHRRASFPYHPASSVSDAARITKEHKIKINQH
jgi:hypothetical protein